MHRSLCFDAQLHFWSPHLTESLNATSHQIGGIAPLVRQQVGGWRYDILRVEGLLVKSVEANEQLYLILQRTERSDLNPYGLKVMQAGKLEETKGEKPDPKGLSQTQESPAVSSARIKQEEKQKMDVSEQK